jgi:hypothetical protein
MSDDIRPAPPGWGLVGRGRAKCHRPPPAAAPRRHQIFTRRVGQSDCLSQPIVDMISKTTGGRSHTPLCAKQWDSFDQLRLVVRHSRSHHHPSGRRRADCNHHPECPEPLCPGLGFSRREFRGRGEQCRAAGDGGLHLHEAQPQSTGRVPTTLVVGVPLTNNPQTVTAIWSGIRNSNVVIDTPATLTAFIS